MAKARLANQHTFPLMECPPLMLYGPTQRQFCWLAEVKMGPWRGHLRYTAGGPTDGMAVAANYYSCILICQQESIPMMPKSDISSMQHWNHECPESIWSIFFTKIDKDWSSGFIIWLAIRNMPTCMYNLLNALGIECQFMNVMHVCKSVIT